MDFESLKRNFLSHPGMSSIVVSAGSGQHVRLFKFRVGENVEYLYCSDFIKSYASAPAFHFMGIVVDGCKLYTSGLSTSLHIDGFCDTMQNVIRHVLKSICECVAETAKDVSVPLSQNEQNEALETAYMAYVRDVKPVFQLMFYGYDEVDMLVHYFADPDVYVKGFARQYFEGKKDYCLRKYSIYRSAFGLTESWSKDKDCVANLSRSMFRAVQKTDELLTIVRSGGKECTANVTVLGNVYTSGGVNGDYQIDSIPVKEYLDSGNKHLTTILKKDIDELCTVDGTVFWHRGVEY